MESSMTILGRTLGLIFEATDLLEQIKAQRIQLPVTIKHGDFEVYVTKGYQDKSMRVQISWEVPSCSSVPSVTSAQPGQP
jgi:hypothetical protein